MSNFLDKWQKKMEVHFVDLKASRDRSKLPIFALEHGIDKESLEEIASQLNQRLSRRERLAPYWLLWIIYATEKGYTYKGDEYWPSFERETPGWDYQERYRISGWFKKFHKQYNGVVPSGPWAMQFRIIAWPITHAILPCFLQRQLARTLHDLRCDMAQLGNVEPATIGRFVASSASNASKRLQQFFQQEELVGRLVLALVYKDQIVGEEPILPATLQRIVGDLEQARDARAWINDFICVVNPIFKGISSNPPTANDESTGYLSPKANLGVRPDLRLYYKGEGKWDVRIDIPSFKRIGAFNPEVHQFLKQTRCTVNGSEGKKPSGWLLSGRRQAVLRQWPNPDKPMVVFDRSNGLVEHLLSSECRMSAGPVWLFRIGKDGLAREIDSRRIRPGQDYVIASKKPLDDPICRRKPCTINCDGINSIRLSIPEAISDDLAEQLMGWEIGVARTIRVWPVGFPAQGWDGEGRGEWLTTEKPCLGIMPDHKIEEFQITLNSEEPITIRAGEPGEPVFMQLPELVAGRHELRVRAKTQNNDSSNLASHDGFLELQIREPELWYSSRSLHTGLIASCDPHDATLDDFWQNETEITVNGPEGRQVTPSVVLRNTTDKEIYSSVVCESIKLPVTPEDWRNCFRNFLRNEKCEWNHLEAKTGILKLDGDELGYFDMRFERYVKPVRWVLRHECDETFIRLVDETDQKGLVPVCQLIEMERPRVRKHITPEQALEGFKVVPPGGLFHAKIGKNGDNLVVSTGLLGSSFADLGVRPVLGRFSGTPISVIELSRVLNLWYRARVAGDLATTRRWQVTKKLMHEIMCIMAGRDWADAEAKLMNVSDPQDALIKLQSKVDQGKSIGFEIGRDIETVMSNRKQRNEWFIKLAKRYHITSNARLCQFALEFACRPYALPVRYTRSLEKDIGRVKGNKTLIRTARLVVLRKICADGRNEKLFLDVGQ